MQVSHQACLISHQLWLLTQNHDRCTLVLEFTIGGVHDTVGNLYSFRDDGPKIVKLSLFLSLNEAQGEVKIVKGARSLFKKP